MRGVDAARSLGPIAAGLVAQGYGFAGRYYSYDRAKNLGPSEAWALSRAGLKIVSVWEAQGDCATAFTAAQGARDAREALRLAQELGQPEGSAIYFAVDFDASEIQIDDRVSPYFAALRGVIGGAYRVGVYGSGLVLAALRGRHLAEFCWLAQSRGWRGYAGFGGAAIEQGPQARILGIAVDHDEALTDEFGGWQNADAVASGGAPGGAATVPAAAGPAPLSGAPAPSDRPGGDPGGDDSADALNAAELQQIETATAKDDRQ